MACRFPRPCSCEFCMEEIGEIRVRSIGSDTFQRECNECFAFGRHETWCDKTL